jgi:hypothetical protein
MNHEDEAEARSTRHEASIRIDRSIEGPLNIAYCLFNCCCYCSVLHSVSSVAPPGRGVSAQRAYTYILQHCSRYLGVYTYALRPAVRAPRPHRGVPTAPLRAGTRTWMDTCQNGGTYSTYKCSMQPMTDERQFHRASATSDVVRHQVSEWGSFNLLNHKSFASPESRWLEPKPKVHIRSNGKRRARAFSLGRNKCAIGAYLRSTHAGSLRHPT